MDGGEDEVFDWGREWVWGGFEEEDGEGVEGSRWVCGGIGEKCGGERGFGGSEKVGETFEDGHLVDEFVDVWDVSYGGEANPGEEWVAHWVVFREVGVACRSWRRRRRRSCGGHFLFQERLQ